jgi:type IV pilus assembly protein PilC
MPLYKYSARDEKGKKLDGMMTAQNKSDLAHTLKNQGLLLVYAMAQKEKTAQSWQGIALWKRVSLAEKMLFIKHMAVMVKAGLPIPRILEILTIQSKSRYFKEILSNVKEGIKTGKTLADSMEKYPKIFPPLFSSSIRVGEVGGNLEEVLELLAIQLEKEHDVRSKVKGAMIYPSVIVVAMVVIGILLMIFVVPNLIKVFSDMNIELPLSTRIIIGSSQFMNNHIFMSLGILILVPVLIYSFLQTTIGKNMSSFISLRIPVVGGIIKKVNTARFARTLSSLLKSGVAIVNALDIISDSMENIYFKKALKTAGESVQKGLPLHEAIEKYPNLFPPIVTQMVKVGEETGSSEQIMAQLADFYEKEVDEITKNLSSVIEPALILILGGAVGFFAISVIQPMYTVMDYIG